jgi:uncharacterized protein
MTASVLYAGTIRHRRFAVREHAFRHDITLAYLDLDELPDLLGGRVARRAPRADHLGDPAVPLADSVRALVAERTGQPAPDGPVRLLTALRSLRVRFNPVSFFYLFDAEERLGAVVAEVTNTPWGESHSYVLRHDGGKVVAGTSDKVLHVSPFMGMDQGYTWRATVPGPTLSVHIESAEAGERAFDATLGLRRIPLTRRSLLRATAPLGVLARIYGQALALKVKGVPVHAHPEVAR